MVEGAPVDRTLAALADPARRGLVELLGQGPQRPSALADALRLSRPALSKHLRVLREAGLLDERIDEVDGRARVVELRRAPLGELRSWVEEVEAFWGDQLAAFKAHAERKGRGKPR